MKIKQGFITENNFIMTKINENIISLELSDEQAVNNILALLNNNVNVENIRKLVFNEKKKKRLIFYITRLIMCVIILTLLLFFFSKDYIFLLLFAGVNCICVAVYSTICDIKRNRQLKNIME